MPVQHDRLEAKGQATKAAVLIAARAVFVRKGFAQATVDDITKTAKVAHGTFYRYFRNKHEVLLALVGEAIANFRLPDRDWGRTDIYDAVREDVTAFFESYGSDPDLARIWVEASTHDKEIAEMRRAVGMPFIERISAVVEYAIQTGAIEPVRVDVAAVALGAMIERFAHVWFVEERHEGDFAEIGSTVAGLWVRSLGLSAPRTTPTALYSAAEA